MGQVRQLAVTMGLDLSAALTPPDPVVRVATGRPGGERAGDRQAVLDPILRDLDGGRGEVFLTEPPYALGS